MSTGKLAALAAFSALLISGAASGEPLPKPALRPGEVIAVTANGCAMIGAYPAADALARFRDQMRHREWRGPCRNGLAHGAGVLTGAGSDFSTEFFYGRMVPAAAGSFGEVSGDAELDSPRWPQEIGNGTQISIDGQTISTTNLGAWPPDYVMAYGIESSGPAGVTTSNCPGRGTPAGCEALWRQLAGPLIASYRTQRAEAERKVVAWRAELTQLNVARDTRFAALDLASGDVFDRGQAAAQAAGGDTNRELKAKLATSNAGQLYAMADQFERAGDNDKAGDALRALLTRFPNHALAVTAAQHLSALPPSRPGTEPCNALAEEAQASVALRAAMARIPSSNAAWKYEAVLAGIQKSAGAWARCPTHPSSAAKIRNYRAAYLSAAARCAMVSPTGACTPNMH